MSNIRNAVELHCGHNEYNGHGLDEDGQCSGCRPIIEEVERMISDSADKISDIIRNLNIDGSGQLHGSAITDIAKLQDAIKELRGTIQ